MTDAPNASTQSPQSPSSSSSDSDSQSGKHVRAPRQSMFLKQIPVPKVWSGRNEQDDVHMFLRRTKRYLVSSSEMNGVDFDLCAKFLDQFVSGDAFKAWDIELTVLENDGIVPTWVHFEKVMLRTFAAMLPLREARMKLHNLVQKDGAVDEYAREMRSLVMSLQNSAYFVSDPEYLFKYYNGLIAPVRNYIDLHAPPDWYQKPQELIDVTLQYEQNRRVTLAHKQTESSKTQDVQQQDKPNKSNKKSKRSNVHAVAAGAVAKPQKKQRSNGGNGGNKEPFIAQKEFMARLKADVCPRCKAPTKPVKGDACVKRTCLKDVEPFVLA